MDTNSRKVNLSKLNKKTEKLYFSLISILIGFGIAAILILIVGESPLQFFSNIIKGNTYSIEAFGNFLATFSWMLLIGLSVAVSFRAGLFNIGVAGQMMSGGIAGYFWAYYVTSLGRAGVIFSILIPLFAGMLIASFIGWLKARFAVNEVISSIMINWVIYYLYKMLTNPSYFDFVNSQTGSTFNIDPINSLQADWLNNIFGQYSFINIGIIIAIIVFVGLFVLYRFTTWGKKQDLIGSNLNAAKYSGINEKREIIKTMALSGALAGLAGSIYYLGINESLPSIGTDIPAEAFNGITISLIAFNSIGGVFFSSIFVAMIYNSSIYVSSTLNPLISNLILGIIVLIISISQFFIIYKPIKKIKAKLEAKKLIENNTNQKQIVVASDGGEILNQNDNYFESDQLIQNSNLTNEAFEFNESKNETKEVIYQDNQNISLQSKQNIEEDLDDSNNQILEFNLDQNGLEKDLSNPDLDVVVFENSLDDKSKTETTSEDILEKLNNDLDNPNLLNSLSNKNNQISENTLDIQLEKELDLLDQDKKSTSEQPQTGFSWDNEQYLKFEEKFDQFVNELKNEKNESRLD